MFDYTQGGSAACMGFQSFSLIRLSEPAPPPVRLAVVNQRTDTTLVVAEITATAAVFDMSCTQQRLCVIMYGEILVLRSSRRILDSNPYYSSLGQTTGTQSGGSYRR